MAQPIIYSTPPLAGRPPFATDEPDSVYDQCQPEQNRRLRQQPPADPNARSSAYNVYDQYLDEKKDNPFDDSKQVHPQPTIPLAAPRPGYAAPVAALNLSRPAPAATPDGRMPASPEMSEFGQGPVSQAGSIPSTPHPLQPPMVPIAPVFARPSTATSRDVKFATQPIMRGDTEDTVLPRRGQKGDDFWRRFSMVAKEDLSTGGQKQSWWLRKTQSGSTRMSRWVWVIGVTLLIIIAGAIGLGWYVSHNSTTHNAPTAIGGSANEKAIDAQTSTTAVAEAMATSTVLHVSPTNTVARRDAARIGSTLCKPIDMDGALTSTARRINLLLALATHMSSGNVLVPALWDRCHSYDPSPVRSFYDPNPLTHPPASPCIDSSICSSRSTL